MLFTANQDAFAALLAQGLIDDAQHDAVLADPATASLPPIPTPAHALAWMRTRPSAGNETQEALHLRIQQKLEADELDNEGADEAENTLLDAFELIALGERGVTREAVLSLHDAGRIDAETRDKALGKAPLTGTAPPSPEATLAWLFPDHFAPLLARRLVTQAQLDAARAHPEFALLPTVPTPGHALAWMWLRGLAPKEDSDAVVERLTREQADSDTIHEAEDAAMDAEELLELGGRGITRDAVLALFNDGLLDAESRDRSLDWVPLFGAVPPEPAATLAWLVTDGPIEEEVFEATAAQAKAEPAFALAADRVRIVDEARRLIAADRSAMADMVRTARQRSGGGRSWPAWLATAAVLGGVGWYLLAPAAVPACDADSTRKTLDGLSLRVGIDARVRNSMSPDARGADALPRISEMRQVGFRKAERVRGCLATIALGDDKETMAYTIGPAAPKSDDMVVRGADPAIVEARFGHLDADGKPLYSTDPIGREALEQAVREAAEQLFPSKASAMVDRLRALGGGSGLVTTDPQRERTIPDLELTGSCRAIDGGAVRSCPLVIEYNDRLLGALSGGGGRSIAVHGEFGFVQDGGKWRASNEFANTFMRAVVASRLTQLGVSGGNAKP